MRITTLLASIIGVLATVSASFGGVIFQSNWDTALGNSDAALRDTSSTTPWTVFEVGGTVAGNPNEMNVVNTTAPVGATNSLRLQQQGSSANGWARVAKTSFTPASTDYYVRYYIRNDDVAGASQDHVVQPGLVGNIYNDLTYLNKGEVSGGWRPRMVLGANQGPNQTMPNWQLSSNTALAYGVWYRFEYWVHFTAAARIQVRIKIYNAANTLLFTEADFIADPGYGQWTTATLATYYAGTNPGGGITDFGITASNLVNIEFGNNGSASSSNTGLFWYFAGVQIRNDTWPGPLTGARTITVNPPCTAAAVNAAIGTAADGDTVLLACTGTQTWTSTVVIPDTKGITLQVQGGTNTPKGSASFPLIISSAADPILTLNCENTRSLSRVTGFKFQTTNAALVNGGVFVQGRGTGATGIGCFRVDNNYFDTINNNGDRADLQGGAITVWSTTGPLTGLIDNNTIHDSGFDDSYVISIEERWQSGGSGFTWSGANAWTRSFTFGTSEFVFIEDNLVENLAKYARHQIEAIQGAKYVARHNTFTTSVTCPIAVCGSANKAEQVEAHGFCFCSNIGHGTRGGEIYNNVFNGTQISSPVLLRGGSWLVHDNTFASTPADHYMFLREYRAFSGCSQCPTSCPSDPAFVACVSGPSAYPIHEQIGFTLANTVESSYFWNNRDGSNVIHDPEVDNQGFEPQFIVQARDYCTHDTTTACNGIGPLNITPYTYPHPLQGVVGPMPLPPANPTVSGRRRG